MMTAQEVLTKVMTRNFLLKKSATLEIKMAPMPAATIALNPIHPAVAWQRK